MIAIPNVDKPKVCADCSVNDMVCGLWMEVANIKAHRHKDCPLIEIVRCGECIWKEECTITELWGGRGFCPSGERRTDE